MNNYIDYKIPFTATFHLSTNKNESLKIEQFSDLVRPLLKEYGIFNQQKIQFKWSEVPVLYKGEKSLGIQIFCGCPSGAEYWKEFNQHCLSLVKQIAKFTNQGMVTYDALINQYEKIEIGNPNIHYYK